MRFDWLYPGVKIKRWLLLVVLGLFLLVSGLTVILGVAILSFAEKGLTWAILNTLGLVGSPLLGGVIASILGLLIIIFGIQRSVNSITQVLIPGNTDNLWQLYCRRRYLARGPRLVAIGGGTGLDALLRGLKRFSNNLTAIVTVADDGGSSGRLRRELSIPPPGDIRNCMVALADTENLMENLFNYRFHQGESLAGHSLGNLLLAAMTDMAGDFHEAIQKLAGVLAVSGKVIPSATTPVVLKAKFTDGTTVSGESRIPHSGKRISRVSIHPEDCKPPGAALEAIMNADAVIIGPGSLYTSILPNLLVRDLADALHRTKAPVIYISNIMTQPGETDGYTVADHLQAIIDHCGSGIIDMVIAHEGLISRSVRSRYSEKGARPVLVNAPAVARLGVKLYRAWLLDEQYLARHDPERLARVIIEQVYYNNYFSIRRWLQLIKKRLENRAS